MSHPGCIPDAQIDAGTNFRHYVELAQMSERGKFDLMFLADALAVRDGNLEALSRWPQYMAFFEPITLLSAIAADDQHIGLVATATTSYNEPYNVARKFASLDHISGGRAGGMSSRRRTMPRPSTSAARRISSTASATTAPPSSPRWCRGLWDSWDDDAFVRDRASRRYLVPTSCTC